jgi:hypothetical protein
MNKKIIKILWTIKSYKHYDNLIKNKEIIAEENIF